MNITIHCLPPSATTRDLIECFSIFGIIDNAFISGDRGYIHMFNRDDGLKLLNSLKNPTIKGKRVYLESENSGIMNREGYRDNYQNPYGNWMEPPREIASYDYGMPPERISHSEIDTWKQGNQDYRMNGSKPDETVPESFVYVDPHGYSRDPTMRPPLEYYYRIKLLDSKSQYP